MDAIVHWDGFWQLPLPIILFILLATGVLVTKRELNNMAKQMEYWRTNSDKKDETIQNQAEALNEYKELAPLIKEVLTGIRKMADEKRDDVRS